MYPWILYKGGDVASGDSRRVVNEAQEAAAEADGYARLPPPPPSDPVADLKAAGQYFDYPRILYYGGAIDGDQVRVKNEDEEAAQQALGFLRLGAGRPVADGAPDGPTPTADEPMKTDKPKGKPGRKPKTPPAE